jgi:hypothetical protein
MKEKKCLTKYNPYVIMKANRQRGITMKIINKVYKNGVRLTDIQIKDEYYALERNSHIPKTVIEKHYQETTAKEFVQWRIGGRGHCDCVNGGEFDLLPLDDEAVQEGGKRYMVCRVCQGWSHL